MKPFLSLHYFCLLFTFLNITSPVFAQTAYEWYKKEISNKQYNEYWANATVDTVINLEIMASASVFRNYGQAVDLHSFLRNKMVTITGGKAFSGQVYFTGKGFPAIGSANVGGPGTLTGIDQLLKKCETGTTIVFDVSLLPDSSSKQYFSVTGGCILTDFQKKDIPVLSVDTTIIEVMDALQKKFTRGTIYFTGTGFSVAESMPAIESNTPNRKGMIARLQPGSSVIFDNCSYWDTEKKVAVNLNLTIKLGMVRK